MYVNCCFKKEIPIPVEKREFLLIKPYVFKKTIQI